MNSAGGRFLDREAVLGSLRQLSSELMRRNPEVQGVLLFGSLARGDYGRRSDADLVILLRSSRSDRPADRIPEFLERFLDAPVPVDVFPLTEEEICRQLERASPFWLRVSKEAMLLAGTPPHCLRQP